MAPAGLPGFSLDSENDNPSGVWGNETTIWVAEDDARPGNKVFAYRLDGSRDQTKDFNNLDGAANDNPRGLWSDGETMFVLDRQDSQVYAYKMTENEFGQRDSGKDFTTITANNNWAQGLWGNADHFWAAEDDSSSNLVFAYNRSDGQANTAVNFGADVIHDNGIRDPRGLWSDGETMFVLDAEDRKVYAFSMADQSRDANRDIALDPENANAEGLWYGGGILWVVDGADKRLYAYSLAQFGLPVNNLPPTGAPTITGVAQVHKTLTAGTSAIFDGNGIFDGAFSYQWLSRIAGSDYYPIDGATDSTYRLKRFDEGKTIRVEVSFTDSAGFREGPLTSVSTSAVLAAGSPDIELSWAYQPHKVSPASFYDLPSFPLKLGYEVRRSQPAERGAFTLGDPGELLAEVWLCDYEGVETDRSCSFLENYGKGFDHEVPPSQEFNWVDESAQPGVSYRYTITPFQVYFSDDGVTVWEAGGAGEVNTQHIIGDPSQHREHRVRIHGDMTMVKHRLPLAGEPATPTNLRLSESQPGEYSNGVVLTWDAAANASSYNIYVYDPEGPLYDKEPPHSKGRDRTVSGITETTWTDTSVTFGRKYTYRVEAVNDLAHSPGRAVASIETEGRPRVSPNKVGSFSAEATRTSATEASVTLSWQTPPDFNSTYFTTNTTCTDYSDPDTCVTTNPGYLIEYRLDIPDRIEPEDEWKPLSTGLVSITDTSISHDIALEEWRMTSTAPKEYVPTAEKVLLRLNDTDTANDWILPFGITYEYRIRAVDARGNMSLPELSGKTRIPNQEGLPPRVLIFRHKSVYETVPALVNVLACYVEYTVSGTIEYDEDGKIVSVAIPGYEQVFEDCLAGLEPEFVITAARGPLLERPESLHRMPLVLYYSNAIFQKRPDAEGNPPDGYRVLVAHNTTRFHERAAVRSYVLLDSALIFGSTVFPYDSGGFDEDYQRIRGVRIPLPYPVTQDEMRFVAVQAYDDDGVGKGDGWHVREIGVLASTEPGGFITDRVYLPQPAGATFVTRTAGGG